MTFRPLELSATAAFNVDFVGSGQAQLTLPALTMTGAATHTPPVFSAAGQATFAGLSIKAVAGPEAALNLFGVDTSEIVGTLHRMEQNQTGRPPVSRVEGRQG